MEGRTGDVFRRPYYRVTTRMLLALGIWPFQSQFQRRMRQCIAMVLILSIVTPQMLKLLESLDNIEIIVECWPMLGLYFIGMIKFINWNSHQSAMKELIMSVERDASSLRDPRDIAILNSHYESGGKLTLIYAKTLFGILALYLASPAVPKILDAVLPLNESRPRLFLYEMEYFFDQDKYYVHILLHAYCTVPVALACIVFGDNFFASLVCHACGMFGILKYRLETLRANGDRATAADCAKTRRLLLRCVNLQTSTIQFINLIESSYTIALLLIFGLNMSIITLTGFVIVLRLDRPAEMLRVLAFNNGAVFHLLYSSWQGHTIAVQCDNVFRAAYQGQWYRMDARLQRMLIPIMMRCEKPCIITAGKIYVMSMESFSAALRACLSFFTLLSSVQ